MPERLKFDSLLGKGWRSLDRFAEKQWTNFLPGAAAAVLRLILLPWLPIPYPATHDEFSYLLAADTFSHVRLTNPSHPMWRFFETIHVISIPTYASKYPPAQGFFLAIGERFFGHPFFGCLLMCFLFTSAVVWMLRAWVSPGTAFMGGCFTALAFGTGNYWMESYWGGAAGATGVALVLGALGRIQKHGRFAAAFPLAIGIVLIWFTRPFEGAFFVLAVAVFLLLHVLAHLVSKNGNWGETSWRPFLTTLILCGFSTLVFQAYYDFRVTGHVTLLPYTLHQQQYNYEPILWLQPQQTPSLEANPWVRAYHQQWELQQYQNRRDLLMRNTSWAVAFTNTLAPSELKERFKVVELVVMIPIILALSVRFWRDTSVRGLLFVLAISTIPLLLESFTFAHYMIAFIVTLIALVFRLVWLCRTQFSQNSSVGTLLASLVVAALLCGAAGNNVYRAWREVKKPVAFRSDRARVERELATQDGKQVLFVRYSANHNIGSEWVYNLADINGSKIVWARDLGAEENQRLINYYPGRHFWLLEADAPHPEPVPYQP